MKQMNSNKAKDKKGATMKLYKAIAIATAIGATASLYADYRIGTEVEHPATQWGRILYNGTRPAEWKDIALKDYTFMGIGDIANLNGQNTSWQASYLAKSQLRYDGWFYVSSDKAGTWGKSWGLYDDCIAFYIDDSLILAGVPNSNWNWIRGDPVEMTEGWHRFTIIAGDTGGGYGAALTEINGVKIPLLITLPDQTQCAFNNENFPQGSGQSVVKLESDTDWSDRGTVILDSGTVLDLNGYRLTVSDINRDNYVGSYVTNSAATRAVLLFTGDSSTSLAVANGLVRGMGSSILVANQSDLTVEWTGGAGNGLVSDANNWKNTLTGEAMVPGSDCNVVVIGSVNFQIPAGSSFACKSFDIQACTLATDCDWSGIPVKPTISGAANLNGHVLTLNSLAAKDGAAFSGADGSAVKFAVADGTHTNLGEANYIDDISNLTLSGSAKILLTKSASGDVSTDIMKLGDKKYAEFVQDGGAVNLTGGASGIGGYDSGAGGHGIYRMNDGKLNTGSSTEFRIGNYGLGEFVQSGGDVNIGCWISIGRLANGNGTCTITGGTLKAATYDRPVWIAGAQNSTGRLNVGGNAVVTLDSIQMNRYNLANVTGASYINVYENGRLNVNRGIETFFGNATAGTASIMQSGGEITAAWVNLAGAGGTASFEQSAGTFTAAGAVILGDGRKAAGKATMDVGGTVNVDGGITIANNANGEGTLTVRKSGVVNTSGITKGNGKGYMVLDGGKVAAKTMNAAFINKIDNLRFTSNGAVIDSAGHDVGVANSWFSEAEGSRIVKTGGGTLTFQSLPHVDSVVVSNGTLAVGSDCDNAASASLAHRWSFTSDLTDSITGMSGTKMGSGAATFENGVVKLPGGAHGTCWIDLGAGKHPSDSLTVEVWMTLRELQSWVLGFVYGTANVAAFCTRRWTPDNYSCNFDSTGGTQILGKALEADKQYYVAITFLPDGNGGVTVRQYVKAVGSEGFLATNSYNKDSWSVLSKAPMASTFSLGYYPGAAVNDMKGEFDEVRVWRGALSPDAIALSAEKGPDASTADVAAIVSKNDESVTLGRSIEIVSGATLDLGGHTLTQPVLDMGGTVANGSLVVTKGLVVTPGQTMTVADGATLDLSSVTEATLKDASEPVPSDGWIIATSPAGGIVPAEPRKLSGSLRDYSLFTTSTHARIGKRGFIILFR